MLVCVGSVSVSEVNHSADAVARCELEIKGFVNKSRTFCSSSSIIRFCFSLGYEKEKNNVRFGRLHNSIIDP